MKRAKYAHNRPHAPRPLNKDLTYFTFSQGTTQTDTTFHVAVAPCTVTGLRLTFALVNNAANLNILKYAVLRLRENLPFPTLASTSLVNFIMPESEVMLQGVISCGNAVGDTPGYDTTYHTKSMRKLMEGDRVVLVTDANAATIIVEGTMQFFLKF